MVLIGVESKISDFERGFSFPDSTNFEGSSYVAESGVEGEPFSIGEFLEFKDGDEELVNSFDHHPLIPGPVCSS
jgi:hypothetical protein